MRETGFAARYFDGASAQAHEVRVEIAGGRVRIAGAATRDYALRDAQISERLARAPRLIRFADGSYLEVADHTGLDRALRASGARASWVERWQNHWPAALAALLATVAAVAFGYAYGLPYFARVTAPLVPPQVEARIGADAMEWLDDNVFAPTRLPAERRERLSARFAQIAPQAPQEPRPYRIEFRSGKIGPNALALPDGTLLITDEIVQLAGSDEAILGVIAHELGHLRERHLLRRLIASAVVGAAVTVLAGDASGVLTALPATLADLSYSRDMEREADRYAIALLRAHDVPLEPLAQLFEAMEQARAPRADKGARSSSAADWTRYLSTHPVTAERVRELRAAAPAR